MPISFFDRLKNGWNAFHRNKDPTPYKIEGYAYSVRPDTPRMAPKTDKTIYNSILTRIAVDVASVDFKHIYVDAKGRYLREADTDLNDCLQFEANIDQTGRAFILDAVLTMLVEGHVAIVPTDTMVNPLETNSFGIKTLRCGFVKQWWPEWVTVDLYNEREGKHEDVTIPKRICAIVQNPFYITMNAPNSTLQRLVKALNSLDAVNDKIGSKKLDIIIQVPYRTRSDALTEHAEKSRERIEKQLASSDYGVAFADNTEKIVQLNRPIESNIQTSVDSLTTMLYGQLSISTDVMNGTADETAMLNYQNRTIEPICTALCEEMTRKFITRTARTQGQRISYFRNPFRLVAMNQIADLADKFTRNEILSPNEMRTVIGMKPSEDASADELRNRNISQPMNQTMAPAMDTMVDENGLPIDPNTGQPIDQMMQPM